MNPRALASVLEDHSLEPVRVWQAPLSSSQVPAAWWVQPPQHPSVPVIALVRYLPAIPTLVAHDEGGHGLIRAAGLHLRGQKGGES